MRVRPGLLLAMVVESPLKLAVLSSADGRQGQRNCTLSIPHTCWPRKEVELWL
jgi:hypothetical protein